MLRVPLVSLALVAVLAWAPVPGLTAQQAREVSLIVANGTVVTMDAAGTVLAPGSVAIDGATIVGVGRPEVIARLFTARDTIDASGQIVLPGLVNTHTHAPMVMFRGLGDDLALMDWLQKYIFPAEAKTVSAVFVAVGTRLAALEMIRSGTTTYADMYYFEEVIARETRRAGLRGVLGQTIIEFPSPDAKTPAEGLKRTEAFMREFARDPLIVPAVAPHSMYTLDAASLLASRDLALKYNTPVLIHLAETEAEVQMAEGRYGQRPATYLDSIGFYGPKVVAAHGVWLAPDEITLLRKHGVGVSHNPESNMKLASGVAPVVELQAADVPVGLGTDGAASNNDLDMFEAMRQTAFLHKVTRRDPEALSAATVLEMATREGARVLGLDAQIGSLENGKLADLILVDTEQAHMTPLYDPVSHLVYTARGSDVRTTIVNGRVLMRDRELTTLNAAQVLADARQAAVAVRAAVPPR